MKKLTYLLIGGLGYIGSHTALELIRNGQNVIILDDQSTGNIKSLDSKSKFYEGDYGSEEILNKIFTENKIDVVMHFAGSIVVSESVQKPLEYYENNTAKLINLLKQIDKHNIKNLIFSSTAAVYGEPVNSKVKETDLTLPINPYGSSKLMSERIIKDYAFASGLNYGILRYFNVTGADPEGNIGLMSKKPLTHLIPTIANSIINDKEMFIFGNDFNTADGTCIRDYIHVTDLANAHYKTAEYIIDNKTSVVFNVGSNSGFSNLEIVKEFENILGRKLKFSFTERRAGDPAILISDNKEITQKLNFKPKYGIKEIIETEWKWRNKNQ